jgi:hypothetical protein
VRIQFSAIQPTQQPDPAVSMTVGPRTFLELVLFSVTVSVVSQIILRKVFPPERS